eukprot:124952-Rhodomonas_salina.1
MLKIAASRILGPKVGGGNYYEVRPLSPRGRLSVQGAAAGEGWGGGEVERGAGSERMRGSRSWGWRRARALMTSATPTT